MHINKLFELPFLHHLCGSLPLAQFIIIGYWFLDLKNGAGSVSSCDPEKEADVVMKSTSEDLVSMFTGDLSPTMAFMGGKLKIKGNMGAAMQLEKLIGQVKSKL